MHRKYGSNLCRLCLQKNDELMGIFRRNPRNGLVVAQVIADLFQIVVSWDDKYPKFICKECYTKIMGFYRMKAKYPVHTLPSFLLFRNQCQIVNSTIDYARRYNVSTPDFQHTSLSWDHSPLSLELEDLAAEDELKARRDAVDNLLESVAQILKNISGQTNVLEDQSGDADSKDDVLPEMLALPDSSYDAGTNVFSPPDDFTPVASDDSEESTEGSSEVDSLVVVVDAEEEQSNSPVQKARRGILRNRELKSQKEEGGSHRSGEEDADETKREQSPSSGPSPRLGRRPRQTKYKRVRYREVSSSTSASESEDRQASVKREGGSFGCAICHKHYSSKESLQSHMRKKHLSKDGWDGSDSSDSWASSPGRVNHHSNLSSTESLDHWQDEPGPSKGNDECDYFRCAVCRKTFSRIDDLKRHVSNLHLGVTGVRSMGAKKTPGKEKHRTKEEMLCKMLRYDEQDKVTRMQCIGCGKYLKSLEDFKEHIVPGYGKSKKQKKRGKEKLKYQCCCCEKTSDGLVLFERHFRTKHSNARPFACEFCGRAFKLEKYLKKHIKLHTDQKTVKCEVCGKFFWDQSLLKLHSIVHSKVVTHKCAQCGKGFRGKHLLRIHEKIHDRSKYLKCPECPSVFQVRSDLNKHMALHSGVRNFQCRVCKKWYLYKRNLNQHMRLHEKEDKRLKVALYSK